jgi:hypothetical protein
MTKDERLRLQQLTDDLRVRLRGVCADWPEDMFDEVIRELAAITLKYEGTATPNQYDRRRTDRLVSDLKEIVGKNKARREEQEDRPHNDAG